MSKPTAKKRARDHEDSDEDAPLAKTQQPKPKRPKLVVKGKLNRMGSIVVKNKNELPHREPGEGYDSEAEDKETDPVIEEQFVLRMMPGEHCDYIRKMIDERKIGVPVKEGGADVQLRWLPGGERRAAVTVKGQPFAAVLVDLPTITEGMKTWDKKNFMKSADICQMLLVFSKVAKEEDAKTIELPKMVAKDYRWPHGLTPPMHDCVNRRFRKRLSKKEIKDKEAELERLLNEDKNALESTYEWVDDRPQQQSEEEYEEGSEMEEDAEGEDEDYFGDQNGFQTQEPQEMDEIDDAALEAEFEAAFDMEAEEETPATAQAATPATGRTGTPAEGASEVSDADDDDDEDLDEDEQARADEVKGVREDIADLKKQIQELEVRREGMNNSLLRKRLEENIKNVKAELHLKQASIGEVDEE